VTMLALNRLDRQDRTALVAQIAGGKALPEEVIDQIVDRTDGVPLFVEELTKSVLESGLLREEGERYVLDGALPPFAIPTTLHDSLMARLDRLASVRHVAQIGAAIGREFSYALLHAVSRLPEDELQTALARLVASELVFQRGTPPDAVYTFKHALVQDAAYGTLLRSRRQQLHARIGLVLETEFPDTAEGQPALLAHHFTEAGLVERAVEYWLKAGRHALTRSAMSEAEALLRKGLTLVASGADDVRGPEHELALLICLGQALFATKGWAAAGVTEAYARARQLCDQLGNTQRLLPILYGQWINHAMRGDMDRAQELAADIRQLGEEQGSSIASGRP
jgi:predicted ATPase